MSKTTKVAEEVYVDENAKTSSGLFVKILTLLLLVGMIVGFFCTTYFKISSSGLTIVTGAILGGEGSIFNIFMNAVKNYNGSGLRALARFIWTNKYVFGILAAIVLMLITTVFAWFSKKAAGVWFRITCVIAFVVLAVYGGKMVLNKGYVVDVIMLVCAIALLFMVIHALTKGKKSLIPLLSLIAMAVAVVYMIFDKTFLSDAVAYFIAIAKSLGRMILNGTKFAAPSVAKYELCAYIAVAVLAINGFLTLFQMGYIKTNWFTVIRYFIMTLFAGAAFVAAYFISKVAFADVMVLLVLTVASLVAFVFSLIVVLPKGKKKEKATDEEEAEMDKVAQPATQQPAQQPVPTYPPYAPYPQPYAQPTSYQQQAAPYQPAPNVYINITPNGATATQTPQPVVVQQPAAQAQPIVIQQPAAAQTQPIVIQQPAAAQAHSVALTEKSIPVIDAPVSEKKKKVAEIEANPVAVTPLPVPAEQKAAQETEAPVTQSEKVAAKAKEKPAKKRSAFMFLALIFAIVTVGMLAYNYNLIDTYVMGFDLKWITEFNKEFYTIAGLALVAVIAIILNLVALIKPSKGCAVWTFLLYAAIAAATFVQVEYESGIVKTVKEWIEKISVDYLIFAMAAVVLAVLCAFIGMIRTRSLKKEKAKKAKKEKKEKAVTEETVVAAPVAEETAVEVEAAPVAEETVVAAPVAEESAVAEEPAAVQEETEVEDADTDAFMRNLSPANKREFNRVFIQGKAPAYLPQYKIGGDNSRFFDAIFVYLGKTRALISDSLLGDMYDFMMENK